MQQPDSTGSVKCLAVRYDREQTFLEAYQRELCHGALLVSSDVPLRPGAREYALLDLAFCGQHVALAGEVVAPRADGKEGEPGVALRILLPQDALRRQLEAVTGLHMPEIDPTPPGKTPRAPRFEAVAPVRIEPEGRVGADGEPLHFDGETANLSSNGMLAVVVGAEELAPETRLALRIQAADGGPPLEVPGRLVHAMECDDGRQALGVQFLYPLERFEQVSGFVDTLRGYHRARTLAQVCGSVRDVPLETLLETVAHATSQGTVVLQQGASGEQQGRIAWSDGEILYAQAGLETGNRALARMFRWSDARFSLEAEVAPVETDMEPIPVASALLLASVERDELARLDTGDLDDDTAFLVDEGRLHSVRSSLDPIARELVENASLGFPLGALLDMASEASDAIVYKALGELIDAGVLRPADATQPIGGR